MKTLWRWTSYFVFLVLALNVGCIFSQNVGQNCLLPPFALQGEPSRDYNPGTPQLQMNNLVSFPQNRILPGGPIGPAPEYQRSPFQDSSCPQNIPLYQKANIIPISPGPCANPGPLNVQVLPGSQCSGPDLLPFPQPTMRKYPTEPPCLSQESPKLPPLEMLPQGPLVPFPGMLRDPCPSLLGNHFTPLIPIANLAAQSSCTDVLSTQGMALPSSCFNPCFPGASIDVFPLEPQCVPALNTPINTLPQQLNNIPIQRPILPAPQINYLPQVEFNQQCDILPEAQSCSPVESCQSSVGPAFQNSLPISPFSMFKLPRPTLFTAITPFQEPLVSSYDPVSSSTNQVIPTLIQQEAIYSQIPKVPAICTPNIPLRLPEQNVQLLQEVSSSICQPTIPLNSNPCSLTSNISPINYTPTPQPQPDCPILPNYFGPQILYSVVCPQNAPLVVSQCPKSNLPPALPISFNRPFISESPSLCQSAATDTVPTPINLQIFVPAPTIPAPRITIINATLTPAVSTTADEASYFDMSYPLPPLIVEGRRSRSRSWLPLLLVALFSRDDEFGGYGGGSSCDCGPTPIPYPIPIPTNNPVIVN